MSTASFFPISSLAYKIADAVPTLTVEQVETIMGVVDDERPEDYESAAACGWADALKAAIEAIEDL